MRDQRGFDGWVNLVTSVILPTGVLTAFLFYFGYASSRAEYEYFGIDVDTVGMDTQEFLMRSPRPLLIPVVSLTLVGILGLWFHVRLRAMICEPGSTTDNARPLRAIRRVSVALIVLGAGALTSGICLIVAYQWLAGWPIYDLLTPLLMALGIGIVAYGRDTLDAVRIRRNGPPTSEARTAVVRRVALILSILVVACCTFWATSTLARWSGRGQAVALAEQFGGLPYVILDTKERLYVGDPVIQETVLPAESGQTFHYRYRNFRLLVQGGDRMFLVPSQWTNSGTTIVMPMDGSVRLQFQFQNPG